MTKDERKARAIQYRAALETGVIQSAFDDIEHQFMAEWKVANTIEERENLHKTIRIITLLRSNMASIAAGEHDGISAIRRIK